MTYTVADIPDLTGRVAVVTGANGGLGLETARALAGAGAHVVMATRDQPKAEAARRDIAGGVADASLEIVPLDLGDLDSVAGAAERILGRPPARRRPRQQRRGDGPARAADADGFEMQLGVNHLGHWALTSRLLPALLDADAARIVTVTSTARHMGRRVDPGNPHLHGRYSPWTAYGQSKLANYVFALGLQRELDRAGARAASLAAHPGMTDTDLQATTVAEGGTGWTGRAAHGFTRWAGMRPAAGALPQIRAATDPAAHGGELYAPRYVTAGPPVRRPVLRRIGLDAAIADLWAVSERETGLPLRVR